MNRYGVTIAVGVLFGSISIIQEPDVSQPDSAKPLITIGKETTYITEPLTADGYVDYFAAVDQGMRRNVTAETNAAVPLVQALGPHVVDEQLRAQFFEKLGIPVLPDDGEYFVPLGQFLEARGVSADPDELTKRQQRYSRRAWTRTSDPQLYDWIVANEKTLDLVVQASKKEMLYLPPLIPSDANESVPPTVAFIIPGLNDMRGPLRALTIRAMLRLGDGDVSGAQSDVAAIHDLARMIGEHPLFINKLVSYAFESMACSAEFAVAHRGHLSATEAQQARKRIEQLPPVASMADALELGERYMFLDVTQAVARNGITSLTSIPESEQSRSWFENIPVGAIINYDVTLKMGNDIFDRMAAASREKDREKRANMFRALDQDLHELGEQAGNPRQLALSLLRGNLRDQLGKMTGAVLANLLLPAVTAGHRAEMRTAGYRDQVRLAYALAAYRADHQEYPKTLDQIVPKYIETLPLDPFSLHDFQYRRSGKGYVLYSVGINGEDDDGREFDDEPEGDDFGARVE